MRDLMKKYPKSKIWDKPQQDWTEKDKTELESMQNGTAKIEEIKIRKRTWRSNEVRVMRIEDGLVYQSIKECRIENGFYKVQMDNLLIEETTFKKI